MPKPGFEISSIFEVMIRPLTYKSIFYLLMSFPLGIFYFIFLITGLSIGLGLLVIFIGIFIIIAVLWASRKLMLFERWSAMNLLDIDIRMKDEENRKTGFWAPLKDGLAWKGIIFLFIKFPLGIFSFVMTVTLLSISAGMIFAPMIFWFMPVLGLNIWFGVLSPLEYNTLSIILIAAGIIILFLSLYFLNGLAKFCGYLIKLFAE